jgi:inorganic triphosphatase YgiF
MYGRMSEELELKLRLLPEQVVRTKRSPLLRSLSQRRATTRHLTSVYYDTKELALAAMGGSLRVRQIGARHLQTLKTPIDGPGGIQAFREIEQPVASDKPDLSGLDDGTRETTLAGVGDAADLMPIFATEFDRTTWPVRLSESEIEVALDVGELRAEERRLPLAEIELELKAGSPARLFELALAIHRSMPVTLELDSKAARGYRLVNGQAPAPQRARLVPLSPEMTARRAFAAGVRSCIEQMRANEASAHLGEDPEGVHQLRVGLRRLRALVGAFRPLMAGELHAYLSAELDWLQAQTGPARDWDVFIAETLERLSPHLPDDPAVAGMIRAAGLAREEGYALLRATLADPRYTELLLRLELSLAEASWAGTEPDGPLERPAAEMAGALLSKRHKKLRKLGGKRADLPEEDLHRLRIAGKKLRYVADIFRALYPYKATTRFIDALARVQDQLGSLNDALVGQSLLPALERHIADRDGIELARRAVSLVRGWQAARIDQDLAVFRPVWREFRDRRPFWERESPAV